MPIGARTHTPLPARVKESDRSANQGEAVAVAGQQIASAKASARGESVIKRAKAYEPMTKVSAAPASASMLPLAANKTANSVGLNFTFIQPVSQPASPPDGHS